MKSKFWILSKNFLKIFATFCLKQFFLQAQCNERKTPLWHKCVCLLTDIHLLWVEIESRISLSFRKNYSDAKFESNFLIIAFKNICQKFFFLQPVDCFLRHSSVSSLHAQFSLCYCCTSGPDVKGRKKFNHLSSILL